MNELKLDNTIAALKVYDEHELERESQFAAAKDDESMKRWESRHNADLEAIGRAFRKDTKHLHHAGQAKQVDLGWIKRIARTQGYVDPLEERSY